MRCVFGRIRVGKYETGQFFGCTRVGAYCIRPEMSCAKDLGLKSGGFLVYPYWDG